MKSPLGIIIISGIMTFIGGFMTLIMVIEAIDAMNALGIYGISIESPVALLGFILYGVIPIMFYAVGIGLFLSRYWAYVFSLKFIPSLITIFFLNSIVASVRQGMYYRLGFFQTLLLKPQIILWVVFLYVVIVLPMISYLKSPFIQLYFHNKKNIV